MFEQDEQLQKLDIEGAGKKNQNTREERLMWLLLIESRKPFLCQRIFLPKKGKMSPDILSGLSKNLAITVHESFNCQRTLLTEKKIY